MLCINSIKKQTKDSSSQGLYNLARESYKQQKLIIQFENPMTVCTKT